jgi:hypothetical protein
VRVTASLLAALALALVLTACGGSDSKQTLTEEQYANAVVNRWIRPVRKDLEIIQRLNNVDVRYYIVTGNPTTLKILRQHFRDLMRCTSKLDAIGSPPEDSDAEVLVDGQLRAACMHYERLARTLLNQLPHLSSGHQREVQHAEQVVRAMYGESRAGSQALNKAYQAMTSSAAFRQAGVQPAG